MPNPEVVEGLSNIACAIASKSSDTFALIIVDGHRTGNILDDLLVRAFKISRNRITKLGPTSSPLQDALNLSKSRDIAIATRTIVMNSSPVFSPESDIARIMVVDVVNSVASIQYFDKQGDHFTFA